MLRTSTPQRAPDPWLVDLRLRGLVGGYLLLAGCSGEQSALDPRGPVAEAIATTWWVMFWGGLVVLSIVMAAVFYAMFRRPQARLKLPHLPFLIGAGLVFPTVTLTALLIYGTDVGRRITQVLDDPLVIEMTGHQWWWEVRYPPTDDAPEVWTANELRLPVGVQIEFVVNSADVIHSLWIPNLGGKVDMIPGRTNYLRLLASEPGRFRAQCSEFCGDQHARMGFLAIAEPQADFDAWRRRRAEPATTIDAPGLAAFVENGCAGCHTIAGTAAEGTAGPTLTHVGDRPTIGATAATNSPQALRDWLADHGRSLKPGNLGQAHRQLEAEDLAAVTRLLEQLQ